MSGAERSYRIALRAFPKEYREERGDEIVGTILEGCDRSFPQLRELLGLFWAGIAHRSLLAGGETTAGAARAGIRLGAFTLIWLSTVGWTTNAMHLLVVSPGHLDFSRFGLPLVGFSVLLVASQGWWSAPRVLVCVWALFYFIDQQWEPSTFVSYGPTTYFLLEFGLLVIAPAFLLTAARPRRDEPLDLRSPRWASAAIGVAVLAWILDVSNMVAEPMSILPLFVVVPVIGLVLGRRDLRLAVAGALVGMTVCLWIVGSDLRFSVINDTTISWLEPSAFVAYAFALVAIVSVAAGIRGREANF